MHYLPVLTIFLSAARLVLANPPKNITTSPEVLRNITDKFLFSDSMEDFLSADHTHEPPELDWSTNGCSGPVLSHTLFVDCCTRHDFGYRNYKKQGRCGGQNRRKIDDKFMSDMVNDCLGKLRMHNILAPGCLAEAGWYWLGVRVGGGQSFC